jgi:hypothetical protein
VRPELPTASVGSSQVPTTAVDNAAPFSTPSSFGRHAFDETRRFAQPVRSR